MTSDDLKHALESVAATERPATDPAADLARARSAARRRTRRRFRAGLVGVASVAVLAVGVSVVVDDDGPGAPTVIASSGVELVAKTFEATPYTFDLTPRGWSVQAQQPTAVTIVPDDGSTSSDPDVFVGKLVILFDANPPDGRVVDRDGRRFWVSGDSGYTTLATRTTPGEPSGVVRIQYPKGAGWDEASMVDFLASVHVGPGARHGLG
ncbi:hypothetical protein ASC77_04830 [Nocardioides sp. Root1257]|uniref:hypothetical protein n=1 Tax=unclassified Nocardioides TaxID=2615069 RepID=UPI0006F7C301|nr:MULTISPECIES: hypothetical protein [unclassified Nocardioides]KQW53597.1 hypothetical protein ASC77_04830 [Nocardioides sp. Root1257]KRC56283.1 hypothetical protein ASE24_04830 [Nocardioides sp. Root224]